MRSGQSIPVLKTETLFGGARIRRRVVVVFAFVVAAVIAGSFIRTIRNVYRGGVNDWRVYYDAGVAFRERTPLYNMDRGPFLTFKNAPIVALGAVPISLLKPVPARIVWYLADLSLLGFLLWTIPRLVGDSDREVPPWVGWIAMVLIWQYALYQLRMGQTTALWVALCAGGFLALKRARPATAGAAFAAAACVKLVPLVFLPYLILRRGGWRGILGFLLTLAILLLAPAGWVGWNGNLNLLTEWYRHLAATETPYQLYRVENASMLAQFIRGLTPTRYQINLMNLSVETASRLYLISGVVTGGMLFGYLWRSLRRTHYVGHEGVHLSLLLIYLTIFNPLAWRYNFIALIVPYAVVLWSAWEDRARRRRVIILTVAAVLLHLIPMDGWMNFQSMGARLWGTVLLAVAVLIAGGKKRESAEAENGTDGLCSDPCNVRGMFGCARWSCDIDVRG